MRKRSEVLRKRSEINRTGDEEPARSGVVRCAGCDEDIRLEDVTSFRDDKSGECPSCGAEISSAKMNDADRVVVDEEGDARTESEMREKHAAKNGTPSGKFCGECGTPIAVVLGKLWFACGHDLKAQPVSDPKKAKRFDPPAGLQTHAEHEARKHASDRSDDRPKPAAKSRDDSAFNASAPAPKVTIDGDRLSVEWGKSTFPLAMMSNFTVGGYFASVQLPPGADRVRVAREILADFRKIADEAFETQRAWYEKKLGSLK